jgi:hypothetical protein
MLFMIFSVTLSLMASEFWSPFALWKGSTATESIGLIPLPLKAK